MLRHRFRRSRRAKSYPTTPIRRQKRSLWRDRIELPYGRAPYPVDLGGRARTVLTRRAATYRPGPSKSCSPRRSTPRSAPAARGAAQRAPRRANYPDRQRRRPGPSRAPPCARRLRAAPPGRRLDDRDRDRARTVRLRSSRSASPPISRRGSSTTTATAATTWSSSGRPRVARPVRVHRCVVDADLVIATGCIRPHYFAGFGAGVEGDLPRARRGHRDPHQSRAQDRARRARRNRRRQSVSRGPRRRRARASRRRRFCSTACVHPTVGSTLPSRVISRAAFRARCRARAPVVHRAQRRRRRS